ncbi:hypothetical protein GIB67_033925 [Kingdonia uniflora]|uniref:NADH-quinone oxidoreductase subunit D domain-containing protein n=2 Tax=Kingdonia uniflora TaxID=39325 RepID=A0A7J7L6Y2_9MAGN|nr:hypothetical protein GIB67_033144 [Kingdonia uniflora]KAF6143163.1 hypothetical protein GIB67_033925 [Kingdonia uniflora]
MEEGTEKKVAATTGLILGQLTMFVAIYYVPMNLALTRPHIITVLAVPYILFHFFSKNKENFIDSGSTTRNSMRTVPSPIVIKTLKKTPEKEEETEENEKEETEETDVEMETTSETKGAKQEQERSTEEDPSFFAEEMEDLDKILDRNQENSNILEIEEEIEEDKLWFEKPLVTLLFDYQRRNRPLRYIKNDQFENAIRSEMSQYFFYPCQSDGKQRISFTYPPSLATFLEMLQRNIFLCTTEKLSSEELYKNWVYTNEQKRNNLSNEFINRIKTLDKGSMILDVLDKRTRFCNDETEQQCLPKIYDPFLNGSYRGTMKKLYSHSSINDELITSRKDSIETIWRNKLHGSLFPKELPRWSYKLEQSIGENHEDSNIISRKSKRVVVLTFNGRNTGTDATRNTTPNPKSTSRGDEVDELGLIEYPRQPDFNRELIKGSIRAQRRKIVPWEFFQANVQSPLFSDRGDKSFFFSLWNEFETSGIGSLLFRNWMQKSTEFKTEEQQAKKAKKKDQKEEAKREEDQRGTSLFLKEKIKEDFGTQGILDSESKHKKLQNFGMDEWKNWLRGHYPSQYNLSQTGWSTLVPQKWRNKLITRNPFFLERVEGVGIIGGEEAINWGLSGPMLRASGIQWDLRKVDHYECYDEFDWEVQWQKEGDSLARYLVRISEMTESIKIIQQALEGISGGPYENLEVRRFDRTRDSEWNDFEYRFISKKPSPTFELSKQELYVRVEAPKGELVIFMIGDQSVFPWRWKISPPGFINLQILPQLISLWEKLIVEMIIDTTEIQAINSFSISEPLKEAYGLIWLLVPIFTLVLGITIGVLVIVWLERQISAGIQQRIGPEYAGPLGILQALADGTKLLFKEDLLPSRGDIRLFSIGPSIAVISILLSYSVVPFGDRLVLADLSIGVFLWIAISSIAPIGLLMSGYGSNNKYSFLGGLRAAAQSISYEIPLTLCVLSISLRAIRGHLPILFLSRQEVECSE